MVTWLTHNQTENSKVWYGSESRSLDHVANGRQSQFTIQDTNDKQKPHIIFIHQVYLNNLKPNTTYCKLLRRVER